MDHQIFFAAGGLVELAQKTGETFGFQKQLFISQAISFCIVAFLLHRFAYKPILKVLEERRNKFFASYLSQAREKASVQIKADVMQRIISANSAL